MHTMRIFLTSLALLAGATCAARAEDAPGADAFVKRLFAVKSFDHKTYACFVRRYDAVHLAQHPQQKVGAMKLLLTAENVPDEGVQYGFRVGVNFRNRPGKFDSGGACGDVAASTSKEGELEISCQVDCDGGGFEVALADGDKSVILRLERMHIWDTSKPGEDTDLRGGADDRVFRLDRVDAEDCTSLVTDRDELAAMRHK
jgi:hypothetical protein